MFALKVLHTNDQLLDRRSNHLLRLSGDEAEDFLALFYLRLVSRDCDGTIKNLIEDQVFWGLYSFFQGYLVSHNKKHKS